MKNTKKSFFAILGVLFFGFLFLGNTSVLRAQSSVYEMSGYAWANTNDVGVSTLGPNGVGWISFRDQSGSVLSAQAIGLSNWGVSVDPATGNLSGYAWANPVDENTGVNNFGWIKFGKLSGFPIGAGVTPTNAKLVGSNLVGWARFCSATTNAVSVNLPGDCSTMNTHPNSGGWDGWISFGGDTMTGAEYGVVAGAPDAQGVRALSGYAWGGPTNVGWIRMDGVVINTDPIGSSMLNFSATTTAGITTANEQNQNVSTSSASGKSISLSWQISKVTGCSASGDWVSGTTIRTSTDGTHIWPPLTFTNATTSPIVKTFQISCKGTPKGYSSALMMDREIQITILPGGNVASVVVLTNPNNVPNLSGSYSSQISWNTNAVQVNTCRPTVTHKGVPGYFVDGWNNFPFNNLPSGITAGSMNVLVPGSSTGDETYFRLDCAKNTGATGDACIFPAGPSRVCGQDLVFINENGNLALTAHASPYVAGSPIVTSVDAGVKISLRWESMLSKDLACEPVAGINHVITPGATSTPATNWFGPKKPLTAPTFYNYEDGIVVNSPTGFSITCFDKGNPSLEYRRSVKVNVNGKSDLVLALRATDMLDGDDKVQVGGKVKIQISKLAGSISPGTCHASMVTPQTTSWSSQSLATFSDSSPSQSFDNMTIGGVTSGTLTYQVSCDDALTGDKKIAIGSVDVVPATPSTANLELYKNKSCIIPGEDFVLTAESTSVRPKPLYPDKDFVSCTTGPVGVGPFNWINLGGTSLTTINKLGEVFINIPYSTHGTPVGSSVTFSISCVDVDGNNTGTKISKINVADKCGTIIDPPRGTIKPIFEER